MLNSYIKTFIEVVNSGSFSSASSKLFVSKVSIMNQINSLEKNIGVNLFQRTPRGVRLTNAGKAFYKSAKKISRLVDNAINEAKQIGGATNQIIRIGTSMMRPCNNFVDLIQNIKGSEYQFNIVPFNDDIDSLHFMLNSLGDSIDCFVSPCGSTTLLMNYGFLPISTCKCAIALSKKHPLAKKEILNFEDLHNNFLLLLKRGNSYVIDEMRDDIFKHHPSINIIDFDGYYDISTFNLCEQNGYLMETLDIWTSLHPSLKTIPVNWKYEMPYGIIYSKQPSLRVKNFISDISKFVTEQNGEL